MHLGLGFVFVCIVLLFTFCFNHFVYVYLFVLLCYYFVLKQVESYHVRTYVLEHVYTRHWSACSNVYVYGLFGQHSVHFMDLEMNV